MTVVVVTPPDMVVDLQSAKDHLRVDHGDDDALIQGFVQAAQQALEGPDGWLGRCLGRQVLELRLDGFGSATNGSRWFSRLDGFGGGGGLDRIPLPYGPVSEIVSVTYLDTAGVSQALAPEAYQLIGGPALIPAFGLCWPSHRCAPEAVRIQYAAGYDEIPAPIRVAILLMVGDFYENREAQVIAPGTVTQINNRAAEMLLSPYRVWSI